MGPLTRQSIGGVNASKRWEWTPSWRWTLQAVLEDALRSASRDGSP